MSGQPVDRVAVVADALQHDELVAAEPRDEMAARGFLDAPPRFDQQRIAGRMAERVVDHLELVEVEAVERERSADAERVVELLLEHRPVGQPSEDVVERELGNSLFAFGDLADHLVEAGGEPRQLVASANPDLDVLARSQAPGSLVEAL